ncbi:DsbC family protein, partial [Rhodanobacter denitrificans]|nr:DsbC family protein [Rhodanobacter denitrificans]
MLKKLLLALCIGGLPLAACAAENAAAPATSPAV